MTHRRFTTIVVTKSAQLLVLLCFFSLAVAGCAGLLESSGPKKYAEETLAAIPLWGLEPLAGKATTTSHDGEVLALKETSERPSQVLSVGVDGKLIAWSLANGTGQIVSTLSAAPQLAAFGERHALVAWASGSTVHVTCVGLCPYPEGWKLDRLKTRFTSLAFHEDDSALLIGGADGRVYRWLFMAEPAATTFKERDKILERYIAHQTVISHVQPLHTGRAFFSADWNGVLHAWLAYTADDQQGSFDRNLFGGRFFGDVGSFMPAARVPDRGITSLGLSRNGRRLAVGTDEGYVEIWEVRGFELVARAQTHTGRVISTSLNSDGSRVVSLGRDGKIVAQSINTDPQYGIAALATRYRLAPFFMEEMPAARRVQFLASGAVILTTDQGQLGELLLTGHSPVAIPTAQPTIAPASKMEDSDY
jgi:WD40 repeat protein